MTDVIDPLDDSPYFDDPVESPAPVKFGGILGGNIKVSSELFKWIAVITLVIAVIWIMFAIFKQVKIAGEDRNQRLAHTHFNNIRGEDFDEEAKNVIEYGEAIENPRAIDHYRVGAVYLLNAGNHEAAHRHFTQALNQIIGGLVDTREAPFILDRIDDFRDRFVDFGDVEELPLQRAMLAHYGHQARQLQQVQKAKITIKNDDPEFKQKTLLARQEWQSDSQNVHDAAIYQELREQVEQVMRENRKINNVDLHGYEEALNWLRVRYRNDPVKGQRVEKVISMINNDYPIGTIENLHERDIITAIWQRSYDPDNKTNSSQIREAMGDAVLDCDENDYVVCMSGRTSKVWQTLATLDKDPHVGVLKSKQAIRNEIYQKAAKVVDDFVGENGSASQALRQAYMKNDNTEQVKELISCMKNRIDDMRPEYQAYLIPTQLDSILEECKAVI